ncbi:hypothetical protein [Magnetospirillum sp. 15-1]|uniref:hypothetical protein n=1 Tax=Magnetospirillum sp. 15-1 TaxID=1979370 RepID=UPI000BBBF967|nr:hypothetical protein [Magnetospirillum sp. 15-1]
MFGFLKTLFGPGEPKARPRPKSKPKAATPKAATPKAATPKSPPAKADPGSDRAALLKRAQEVHRAKRKILDALSDEDRAKLVGMAILTFLNQGREPDDKKR